MFSSQDKLVTLILLDCHICLSHLYGFSLKFFLEIGSFCYLLLLKGTLNHYLKWKTSITHL